MRPTVADTGTNTRKNSDASASVRMPVDSLILTARYLG